MITSFEVIVNPYIFFFPRLDGEIIK